MYCSIALVICTTIICIDETHRKLSFGIVALAFNNLSGFIYIKLSANAVHG